MERVESRNGGRVWPFVLLAFLHPHSGIATLTVVLRGGLAYEDTTGKKGSVPTGGLEWMKAGNGVWHDGAPTPGEPLRVFQLWMALPPSEENAAPESQYIPPDAVEHDGPVRVILGRHGRATSPIRAPAGINYFHVRLKDGQRWRHAPAGGPRSAGLAGEKGVWLWKGRLGEGSPGFFGDSGGAVGWVGEGESFSVLDSGLRLPLWRFLAYFLHYNGGALGGGEKGFRGLGGRFRAKGRLEIPIFIAILLRDCD